jgi:succinate dehydrogenase/fumarate reductase flavoprotein subunit
VTIENTIETDVLVIGGGMAGLFASIKAREEGVQVTLVDKNYVSRSGSTCFADGDFSVFNPEWGHELNEWKNHINRSGEYLNNPAWTEVTLKDSLARFQDLLSWGVNPVRQENGEYFFVRYPGRTDLVATKMAPVALYHGWGYLPIMRRQAIKIGVRIIDRVMITDLIKQDNNVAGAVGFNSKTGDFYIFKAKATVISAGSGNFRPDGVAFTNHLSFDGESIAYRAGAEISGKEFAVTGRGGVFFRNWEGQEKVKLEGKIINTTFADYPKFCHWFSPMIMVGSLVDSEGYGSGGAFRTDDFITVHEGRGPLVVDYDNLLPRDLEWAKKVTRPNLEHFKRVGIDPTQPQGLWSGIARYETWIGAAWGGIAGISSIDLHGATSLPGLYAAGDSYHSTAIGATYPNIGTGTRNASVTGARAGQSAAKYSKQKKDFKLNNEEINRLKDYTFAPLNRKGGFDTNWVTQQIQNNTLPYYILYVRHADRLKAALGMMDFLRDHTAPLIYAKDFHQLRLAHETKNRILSAEMMLRSSLFRKESRGKHYREDYPRRDDPAWLAMVKIKKDDKGEMKLIKKPLPTRWWAGLLSIPYKERYLNRYKGEEK